MAAHRWEKDVPRDLEGEEAEEKERAKRKAKVSEIGMPKDREAIAGTPNNITFATCIRVYGYGRRTI